MTRYGDVRAFIQAKAAFETLVPPAPQTYRIPARSRAV